MSDSVFVTGPPGAGKSTLVKSLIDYDGRQAKLDLVSVENAARRMVPLSAKLLFRAFHKRSRASFIKFAIRTIGRAPSSVDKDKAISAWLQAFAAADYRAVGKTEADKLSDLNSAWNRLSLFEAFSCSLPNTVMYEDESHWHKLLWTGIPEAFSVVPYPAAAVFFCIGSPSLLLERRLARGSRADRALSGAFGPEQQRAVIEDQMVRWNSIADHFEAAGVRTLKLDFLTDISVVTDRVYQFLSEGQLHQ